MLFPPGDSALDSGPRAGRCRIPVGFRRWRFFGVRDSPAERLDGAPAARGPVKKLRRGRNGFEKTPEARAIHFPDGSSRTTEGRSESSRRSPGEVAAQFCITHDANAHGEV